MVAKIEIDNAFSIHPGLCARTHQPPSCAPFRTDLTGEVREGGKRHEDGQKCWVRWTGRSDGETSAPQKLGMFIKYS